MFISYFDESGDDGYPNCSSPIFVLTSVYLHHQNWKEVYSKIHSFRKQMKTDFNLPIKIEMHIKHFLLNKNPYRQFSLSDEDRIKIIDLFCDLISQLSLKVINVVINKDKISTTSYDVLDRALTYSVQRIENDLMKIDPINRYIIITDEGRVGKMIKTTRRIQKINFIPSKFSPETYRQEIKSLIEDPLPKSSKESHFIQIADIIAYTIYLYSLNKLAIGHFPNRLSRDINADKIKNWMERLKGSLNKEASRDDEYGVVIYPK